MMTRFVYFPLTGLVVSRSALHTKSNNPNDPHDPERVAANIGSPSNGDTQLSSRRRPKSANAAEFSCQAPRAPTLELFGLHPSSHQPRQTTMGPHSSAPGSGLVWSLTSPDADKPADKPAGGASRLLSHCKGLFEMLHEKAQKVCCGARQGEQMHERGRAPGNLRIGMQEDASLLH